MQDVARNLCSKLNNRSSFLNRKIADTVRPQKQSHGILFFLKNLDGFVFEMGSFSRWTPFRYALFFEMGSFSRWAPFRDGLLLRSILQSIQGGLFSK